MALNAATAWECRAGGSNNNGGGFADLNPGTSVDYSQQVLPVFSPDNLIMAAGSTALTQPPNGSGFTAAMVGNVIQITSGTHFVPGWYQITGYFDPETVSIDRNATDGSSASGGQGYVGGAMAAPTDTFLEQVAAGNTIYMQGPSTFTLTGSIALGNSGTATNPITVCGYYGSRGTPATGNDRPNIVAGANAFTLGNFWAVKHLRGTIEAADGFCLGEGVLALNCAFENNSATANRYALRLGNYGRAVDCWVKSANGRAMSLYYGTAHGCVAEGSNTGFYCGQSFNTFAFCVATGCSVGFDINARYACRVLNSIAWSCGVGISGTTGHSFLAMNNVITLCTTGASWTTETPNNFWDYNDFYSFIDQARVNVAEGPHDLAVDPQFADPVNGDFRLGVNLRGAGFPGALPGLSTTGYLDCGPAQRREAHACVIGG